MIFSATGNLLPGSLQQPDIKTFVLSATNPGVSQINPNAITTSLEYKRLKSLSILLEREEYNANGRSLIISKSCRLNQLGYLPVLSTLTGLGRALLGLVHTIAHLACAIFSNRADHLNEASLGVKNIGRGLLEAIPLIGNISLLMIDILRCYNIENGIAAQILVNEQVSHHVSIFVNQQQVSRRPFGYEVAVEIAHVQLNDMTQLERIVRNEN